MSRSEELAALQEPLRRELDAAHGAREVALDACRRTIRLSSTSIRATHRRETERAAALADEAAGTLRQAQAALAPYPELAASGPLHDAAKEYAEARLTAALVAGEPLPTYDQLDVSVAAWLCGVAEAASELRRHLLDRLREDDMGSADRLLTAMGDVYDMLVTIDYPDAVTGGLRRTTDALRAVLERSRGDLTITQLQTRLQAAIEVRLPPGSE